MKMDDVPDEIEVKGVKGKRRYYGGRHYIGKDRIAGGWALDVTYRFPLTELHEVDAAKYYPLPDKVQSSKERTKNDTV